MNLRSVLLAALAITAGAGCKPAGNIPGREGTSMHLGGDEIRSLTETGELSEPQAVAPVVKDDSDWRRTLSPERYRILREHGTERAFTGELLAEKRAGWYVCHACGLPLFRSDAKFESHCGWPSFHTPAAFANVRTRLDTSNGMHRVEILCARCGGHLGHVFEDGPQPTGLRYCVNSLSLDFKQGLPPVPPETDTAIFAAGCFWGVEKIFYETPGVVSTAVGYTGGTAAHPTYKQVCSGSTGHAEAVEVVYDPARVSYRKLAELFFLSHDPTTVDRQGPDVGRQYRSGVFWKDEAQRRIAEETRDSLSKAGAWSGPVVTEIVPASTFWRAEDYHQKWFLTHPVQCHRPPGR